MVGQNQSFQKVLVTNDATLQSIGTDIESIVTGRLGIVDAKTYKTVVAPSATNNPELIFALGTPDVEASNYNVNDVDKTKNVIGRKITRWQGKKAKAGQNHIVAIGHAGGTDEETITGKCDEILNYYVHLSGAPISRISGSSIGYVVHLQATGPCCDECGDNCENVISSTWRDQFYDQLMEHKLPGGVPLTKFIEIEKIDGTNGGGDDIYGLKLEGSYVSRTSTQCYFDIFPYDSDPIQIKGSSYNVDWHEYSCTNETINMTEIQAIEYPSGHGEYVLRRERDSKMRDGQYYSDDMPTRLAEGTILNTDPSKMYDCIILGFEHEYFVGGWSQKYKDNYIIEFYFETGEATAFLTAMNTYVTNSNPALTAISL